MSARVGPAPDDWSHACRVAIGLLIPGLALVVLGYPELIIYAVFGSFTGMYGRTGTRRSRLRHQAQAGAVLSTAVGIGSFLSGNQAQPWILVSTVTAFAFVGALVTTRLDLSPRGPFFGIFALGATATVPARVPPLAALSICAGTVVFSVLIGLTAAGRAQGPIAARCLRGWCGRGRQLSCSSVHALRYAVAVVAAGAAGLLLGVDHANWAMASAAVPLAVADTRSLLHPGIGSVVHRSLHRVGGTLAGLVVTAGLLQLHLGTTSLAVVVMVLLFPTELFMARHYGLALGFFTPLIMVMTELASPAEPATLLTARLVDTLIGVAAGIAASVVVRGPCRSAGDELRLAGPRRRPVG
ncbi:FUSC family protein [Amycolatopsis sp. WAC 04182]|uniref:FUSC family protein n=1 Tax=Amycolatopsis sp. WAC 04182 TaxID=2203198 RepID=UPI000F7991FA|nr:FUSC family protein [Amycolatopsis sp. WAC 04182]RSN55019.1 FUSC family protein [Amycolatopsis sp. WAC 04182]